MAEVGVTERQKKIAAILDRRDLFALVQRAAREWLEWPVQGYPEWALYRGRLRAPFREYAALLADVPPYEKVLAHMMPSLDYLAERWEQMTDAYVVEARPYWRYVCALLPDSRPSHVEKHGLILAASDPFWQKWYPLNGFGCRCAVVSLSPEEAREEGGVSRGYSFRYPEPDEGFAFNIGKELMG